MNDERILPTSESTRSPRRILVADDDQSLREVTAKVLIHSGFVVDAAVDGAAAWQALNSSNYDLLVTDHEMPAVSGLQLVEKLRAAHMALPVILVSAAPPAEQLQREPWLHIEATLAKPYSVEELLDTVREVLHIVDGVCAPNPPPPNQQNPSADNRWRL